MVYVPLFICLFVYLFRQEAQNQPYTCSADRKGLDRDRVNHFHLPCNLCVYCVLVSSLLTLKAWKQNEAYRVKKMWNGLSSSDKTRYLLSFWSKAVAFTHWQFFIHENVRFISNNNNGHHHHHHHPHHHCFHHHHQHKRWLKNYIKNRPLSRRQFIEAPIYRGFLNPSLLTRFPQFPWSFSITTLKDSYWIDLEHFV